MEEFEEMKRKRACIIILLVCMILSGGCGKKQDEEIYYETYVTPYQLTEDYSFDCIQVRGMEDQQLQAKINNSLTEKLYILRELGMAEDRWVPEAPVIHLQTSRYLSVEMNALCVTVDVQTGEIVYLDDLIMLDEEFATTLKNCRILKRDGNSFATEEEMTEFENDIYNDKPTDLLLALFWDYTKGWMYEDDWIRIYHHPDYSLEEGYIVIYDGKTAIRIDISRLDELLLVEKW